jgi:hypothetical protein
MAEQSPDILDTIEELPPVEAAEPQRETTDYEKRLRREVVRYREQARVAHSEREIACAAAVRDRDEAVAAARDDARKRVLQAELKTHAIRSGIVDLDGLRLADTEAMSVDEAGEVQGVEEVIATLRERKPYLFSTDVPVAAATTITTAQLQRAPTPAQPSNVDARSLSREAWQAERDRLLASSR